MKGLTAVLTAISLITLPARAQQNPFRLKVLAYQWTTTNQMVTFTWPGHAYTSCNGDVSMSGYVTGGGHISADGTTSSTCSTTFMPPTTQNIDVQKPVLFILAETDNVRMILTCTRNIAWSQCRALSPGTFVARIEDGNFEVGNLSPNGKEEWTKFGIVQQTGIPRHPKLASAREGALVPVGEFSPGVYFWLKPYLWADETFLKVCRGKIGNLVPDVSSDEIILMCMKAK